MGPSLHFALCTSHFALRTSLFTLQAVQPASVARRIFYGAKSFETPPLKSALFLSMFEHEGISNETASKPALQDVRTFARLSPSECPLRALHLPQRVASSRAGVARLSGLPPDAQPPGVPPAALVVRGGAVRVAQASRLPLRFLPPKGRPEACATRPQFQESRTSSHHPRISHLHEQGPVTLCEIDRVVSKPVLRVPRKEDRLRVELV